MIPTSRVSTLYYAALYTVNECAVQHSTHSHLIKPRRNRLKTGKKLILHLVVYEIQIPVRHSIQSGIDLSDKLLCIGVINTIADQWIVFIIWLIDVFGVVY